MDGSEQGDPWGYANRRVSQITVGTFLSLTTREGNFKRDAAGCQFRGSPTRFCIQQRGKAALPSRQRDVPVRDPLPALRDPVRPIGGRSERLLC